GAAEKRLTAPLGQLGEVVSAVQPLEKEINAVADPGQNGVGVEKVVEGVSVQYQNFAAARDQHVLILDGDAEQVGDDLGRAVVIATYPGDIDAVGKFTQERKHLPVILREPAKVDGIEDVTVQDEFIRDESAFFNAFQ